MNIKRAQAERFLASPPAELRAVLLYGPDAGLVDERGRGLLRLAAGADDDPFRAVELSRRDVESDPARLADELAALSFTGGRRGVRLRDATDGLAGAVEAAVEAAAGADSLLVVEAGDLPGRSALRKLFEPADTLAAVPCYRDDESSLPGVIREALEAGGLRAEPEALDYLARNLGGDRQVTRRELEKLLLYKARAEDGGGEAPAEGLGQGSPGVVALEDVEACIGDSAEITQEDLAFSVAEGAPVAAERAFGRAIAEGVQPVSLVRTVARHFQRLHQVAGAIADGVPLQTAVGRLRPPVFWKRREALSAQAGRWSVPRLRDAVAELTELEVQLKSGEAAPELLAGRALLRLAVNAPSGRRAPARR